MRETKTIEFKRELTKSFLKTVSAYANYGSGHIFFGITDDGEKIGVANPQKLCLEIETLINDSVSPVPSYTLEIDEETSVVDLSVKEGFYKPYFYHGKAYRRNDAATIETDRFELSRLILDGQNLSYEELPAQNQDLTFTVLEQKLREKLRIEKFSLDVLKTLRLYDDEQRYNKAAELLADHNAFHGIDIGRFGDTINIILDRETLQNQSILSLYDRALDLYRKYYQYDIIEGSERKTISLLPEEAFREVIANSLVHRTWDVPAHITVYMFPDRIEIHSPGGLPKGLSEESYLSGGISILRNLIIGNLFLRLGLIERFGTGIRRIKEAYLHSEKKPIFKVSEDGISIILPVILPHSELSGDERSVYECLLGRRLASSEVAEITGWGKSKVLSVLRNMEHQGYIRKEGSGRGTKYSTLS